MDWKLGPNNASNSISKFTTYRTGGSHECCFRVRQVHENGATHGMVACWYRIGQKSCWWRPEEGYLFGLRTSDLDSDWIYHFSPRVDTATQTCVQCAAPNIFSKVQCHQWYASLADITLRCCYDFFFCVPLSRKHLWFSLFYWPVSKYRKHTNRHIQIDGPRGIPYAGGPRICWWIGGKSAVGRRVWQKFCQELAPIGWEGSVMAAWVKVVHRAEVI